MSLVSRKFKWYRNKAVTLFYQLYSPKSGTISSNNTPRIIVTMTSFTKRLDTLYLCVKSLLNQKRKPDRVILYLGKDVADKIIPDSLRKLEKFGLEIKTGYDDIKPHKKYYYAMQEYPEDIIITVDDDVIYHRDLVSGLMEAHQYHPDAVICRRARKVLYDDEGHLLPYNSWPKIDNNEGPAFDILPTGVGGVLYPPHCLHEDVFDKDTLTDICLKADDIWLKYMEVRKGTKVVFTKAKHGDPGIIPKTFSSGLYNENVNENQNDLYLKKMCERYHIDITGKAINQSP